MAVDMAVENTLVCCDCPRDVAKVLVDNAASESLQTGDRDVRVTLGAVSEIVRKMDAMPGQRTLILVSPGFLTMTAEALTMKSQILDLAAQSNVTINGVDARGLYTTALDASDRSRGSAMSERTPSQYRGYSMVLNEDVMAELAWPSRFSSADGRGHGNRSTDIRSPKTSAPMAIRGNPFRACRSRRWQRQVQDWDLLPRFASAANANNLAI